ncbi:MAG: hypothetical protein LBC84_05750 [Prevotellaceae bacterium]|jgi:uncharacterized protein YfaS (alpha-2-macroglobulin family)|nr:hypothetical protein [Prevotellaceae bacterium]
MKASAFLLSLLITTSMFAQKTYTQEWKQIDSLYQLQQPQSAQKIIDIIYHEAQVQNNVAQFVKAHLYRSASQNLWEEEGIIKAILEAKEAITKAKSPTRSILHSIAADLYWRYYTQNRWRFSNRTATETASDDIRTWDSPQLIETIIAHHQAALLVPEPLQKTALEPLSAILQRRDISQKYRPTLYDLLAFRAIEFYSMTEVQLLYPQAAISLLEEVVTFHSADADPTALIDAELHRLDYLYKSDVSPQKENDYIEALSVLNEDYTHHPSSTEMLYRLAKVISTQGKKLEAMKVIEKALATFPDSFGAINCRALKDEIKRPELSITADDATLPNKPFLLSIQYKNIPTLFYKVIPICFKEVLEWVEKGRKPIDLYSTAYTKSIFEGEWTLPNIEDYQTHTIEMALPGMREGHYIILASTSSDFSNSDFLVSKSIWATQLSYVWQETSGKNTLLVLDRETGKPVGDVEVQEYYSEYDAGVRKYVTKFGKIVRSNGEGVVHLQPQNGYRSINFYFTCGNDQYASGEGIYLYNNSSQARSTISTTFFADRAIYRPGQTIWFKGVVLEWNHQQPKILEKQRQTVTLYNVNREKISEMEVISNEFGAFSGSFTIPSDGLTGYMRIEGENGSLNFRVEEYKRPKFEVTFTPVADSYRLGDEVTVTAKAMNYAGNAVSEAKVSYRVVRQALFPMWRWWWGPRPLSPAQEIVTGETTTQADGSCDISFTAIPDVKIDKKENPVFHFTVYVSVTDVNGETHENNYMIPVGYQSLLLSTSIPEKMNLDQTGDIQVIATNLNDAPQPAQGTITIWKLRHPDRVMQERRWARPDQFSMTMEEFIKMFPNNVYDNEDNVGEWEKEKLVAHLSFDTKTSLSYPLPDLKKWKPGKYMVELRSIDAFGEAVENSAIFTLFSAVQQRVPAFEPIWFHLLNPVAQPDETVKILVGSAYPNVEAFYEVGKEGKPLRKSVVLNNEQKVIEIPVTEKDRGNISVQLFFVKDNRSYSAGATVRVPYDNKQLSFTFASYRDKLQPGQEEEWHITIKDKAGDAVAAELLASMYDASLDAFVPHAWRFFPWPNNQLGTGWRTDAAFRNKNSTQLVWRDERTSYVTRSYDKLLDVSYLINNTVLSRTFFSPAASVVMTETTLNKESAVEIRDFVAFSGVDKNEVTDAPIVQIRSNFNETAFFYPHLRTNEKGETVVRFTIPEALTRWKMQGLAWTRDLQVGITTKELVTQKELMIFTNPPRFFRENDTLWFSAKVSNLTDKALNINTELQFFDALTMRPVSKELLLENGQKTIEVTANGNEAISWKMQIPKGLQAITYRITAIGNTFSDGEEGAIPVLTNRMLVTESLPLPVRGNQTKSFTFDKLLNNQSSTLTHHAYTLEFTSNPAWSAIQALPYIMEYPYECVEQTFSRFYANSIATHIANSDPRIKQIFSVWRNYQPNALQSNLEKNQELKALLIEETPWVRAAQNESEQKQRIALLFDLNRMSNEKTSALSKVEQAQLSNGGFAWFKGGPDSRYITQHIVAGLGHLQKMGISTQNIDNMLKRAIGYLDARITEEFNQVKEDATRRKADYTKENHLTYLAIHYLYARSFFTQATPIPQHAKEAFNYYVSQASLYWTAQNNYLKGMTALALHRFGNQKAAQLIMKSLSETALRSNEMGMYWKSNPIGWWWYQAPVETHALMIEAYHEVLNDQKSVDELKVWLLKQKQTQDWKTTKATSEAIYALLLTGSDLLASETLCQVSVGDQTIDPNTFEEGNRPQAGTGYFKTSWRGEEVKPDMGQITVSNPNPVVAWGAAYWQYFEQLDKIESAETGVSIKKQLFVKSNTSNGPVLKEITSDLPIIVGDKVTVRLEICADRDMEYVHLKDQRASAFEPVNVLSGYRWQDGLGYYESTRDAATNFFISYLPKGTYVFEYDLFATQQGEFSNGVTTLQCMYAPEFSTHSEGIRVRVTQ